MTTTRLMAAPALALAAALTTPAFLGAAAASASTGPSWSIQQTPNPKGATFSGLNGVSCPSVTACMAAGFAETGNPTKTLAERWNGTTWAIQPTPNPAGSPTADLRGVSCSSATACTAVGDYVNSSFSLVPLAERWNGSTWTAQSIPSPTGSSTELELYGVSCPTATACTAVGSYLSRSDNDKIFAEHWNGTTWALQPVPVPAGSAGAHLYGVSCSSATACTAIGDHFTPGVLYTTLAERWNGTTWKIQATPNPAGSADAFLFGVSCPTRTACTAAGDYETSPNAQKTLAEHWNGTTWTVQSTPNPVGIVPTFNGVSCVSATACTAAGDYLASSGHQKTLAEHWNGTTWGIQSTPSPAGNVPELTGVSCPAEGRPVRRATAAVNPHHHRPLNGVLCMAHPAG
jgi:hypothetical protein